MEGTSHPEGTVPEKVQFVLDWNPPLLTAREPTPGSPSNTAQARNAAIGYSRPAAFYDKHLASHLILEHVVYLDTLVSAMGRTVDQAIQDASNTLPRNTRLLPTPEMITDYDLWGDWSPYDETGVANIYSTNIARHCQPIASTLAVHPSSETWRTVIAWCVDQKGAQWANADGVLRMSVHFEQDGHPIQQLVQGQDPQTRAILKQLATSGTALALWEMKWLTVGTAEVMNEIAEMGVTHAKFRWKKCSHVCNHPSRLEHMKESGNGHDPGFDPRSPPWILPIDLPTSAAAYSPSTPLCSGLRNASAQGASRLSYKEVSSTSLENDEEVSRKSDDSDESYETPPNGGREAAQSFLQQTWAEAVRSKCTIMVLHSGNHEIIGIRHRKTQTLYISPVIEPHNCSDPAYGKLQVGIYIAAIKETIDRAKQDISKRERARDPSVDIPPRDEEANPDEDEDLDDYSEKPSRSNKRIRRSGSKRERKGRDGGNAKRHMSGKENDQALLALAAKQNYLCLRFFYDIYDSPYPAIFRRVDEAGSENAPGPAKSQNPPLSETTLMTMSATSIHVTVQSELQPGSTGIVHIGTMAVDLPGPTAKVAVKLAFSSDEKSRLVQEHRMYSHLHSKGVRGIPYILGLFVDAGRLLGAEGPYALVTSYTGVSLSDSSNHASDSLKYSLLETLKSIHTVDILHGDIRLPNFCITPSGEAFVIDFSHATRSCSQEDKDQEIRELSHILGVDSPSEIKSLEKNAGLYRDAKRARYELEGTRSQAQALETALDESTSLVRFASNRSRSIYGSTSNIASTESLIKSI